MSYKSEKNHFIFDHILWCALLCTLFMGFGCDQADTFSSSPSHLEDLWSPIQYNSDSAGFEHAKPGAVFSFPKDHGEHRHFQIEWWYITANLTRKVDQQSAASLSHSELIENMLLGESYGVQWTLFRYALRPPLDAGSAQVWSTPQIYMAHSALTTPIQHFYGQRYARSDVGHAGVVFTPFKAWIDEWALVENETQQQSNSSLEKAKVSEPLSNLSLTAGTKDFYYDLQLINKGPLIKHGDNGFSIKHGSQGAASYYYSQPFLDVTGEIQVDKERFQVQGLAWMDREWSSGVLLKNQLGWDWFSLHFRSGHKLMMFQTRHKSQLPFTTATWISPSGETKILSGSEIQLSTVRTEKIKNRVLPMTWQVIIDDLSIDITVDSTLDAQWMGTDIEYWEGSVHFKGSHEGVGYMELTGYSQ